MCHHFSLLSYDAVVKKDKSPTPSSEMDETPLSTECGISEGHCDKRRMKSKYSPETKYKRSRKLQNWMLWRLFADMGERRIFGRK
jgi:hypothetical protein